MEHQSRSSHEFPNDDLLVERCLKGDAEAWKKLVELVRELGLKSLLGRSRWALQDIEDVVQQTSLALLDDDFRILRSYDSERARLRTFLAGVFTREALRYARRRFGREQLWVDPPQPAGRDATAKAVARLDAWDVIQQACSPTDALILRLTAWGYRSDEIADILTRALGRPMSKDNVRQRRKRAYDRLRSRFGDDCSDFFD